MPQLNSIQLDLLNSIEIQDVSEESSVSSDGKSGAFSQLLQHNLTSDNSNNNTNTAQSSGKQAVATRQQMASKQDNTEQHSVESSSDKTEIAQANESDGQSDSEQTEEKTTDVTALTVNQSSEASDEQQTANITDSDKENDHVQTDILLMITNANQVLINSDNSESESRQSQNDFMKSEQGKVALPEQLVQDFPINGTELKSDNTRLPVESKQDAIAKLSADIIAALKQLNQAETTDEQREILPVQSKDNSALISENTEENIEKISQALAQLVAKLQGKSTDNASLPVEPRDPLNLQNMANVDDELASNAQQLKVMAEEVLAELNQLKQEGKLGENASLPVEPIDKQLISQLEKLAALVTAQQLAKDIQQANHSQQLQVNAEQSKFIAENFSEKQPISTSKSSVIRQAVEQALAAHNSTDLSAKTEHSVNQKTAELVTNTQSNTQAQQTANNQLVVDNLIESHQADEAKLATKSTNAAADKLLAAQINGQHTIANTAVDAQNTSSSANDIVNELQHSHQQVVHQQKAMQKQDVQLLNDTISIMRKDFAVAVKEKVMVLIQQKIQQADIQLDPPELGQMQVKVQMHNNQAVVNFVVQNPQAKEALEQHMGNLKSLLTDAGVNVADANVEQGKGEQQTFAEQQSQNFGSENEDFDEQPLEYVMQLNKASATGVDYYA